MIQQPEFIGEHQGKLSFWFYKKRTRDFPNTTSQAALQRENASNLESRSSTANWKPFILLLFYSSSLNKAIITDLIKRALYFFFTEGFKTSTGWLVDMSESREKTFVPKAKKELPEDNRIHLYTCSCITVAWKTENSRNDDFFKWKLQPLQKSRSPWTKYKFS